MYYLTTYRRNEQIIGVRAFLTKQPGGTMTVTGDDPKKFAAAMIEYSKEKVKVFTHIQVEIYRSWKTL